MAARRLAISSLLCPDDSPPPSASIPSRPSPSPVQSRPILESRSSGVRAHDRPLSNIEHPVHLWRHTPSPHSEDDSPPPTTQSWSAYRHRSPDRVAGYADTRPAFSVHGFDFTDHAGRRPPLQAESSHPQPSLRVSDPYHQHSYSPPSTSYSTRPSSSRSEHSDSPSTSQPYAIQPPPHSPSQSPASIYNLLLHRQASESPVLSSRHASASPINYYNPVTQPESSYRTPQLSYHQVAQATVQGRVLSGPASPPLPFSTSHQLAQRVPQPRPFPPPHSALALSDPVPTVRNTSAAALPNILNSYSPPQRSSGLGGLEALVQAATEERRRLSGEISSSEAVRRNDSPRTSLSPVMGRASAQPEAAQQRQLQQPTPSPQVSHPALGLDIPALVSHRDGEPPLKRRRGSGVAPFDVPVMAESHHHSSLTGASSVSPLEVRSPSGFQFRSEVVQAPAPANIVGLGEGTQRSPLFGPGGDGGGAAGSTESALSSYQAPTAATPPAPSLQPEDSGPQHSEEVFAGPGGQPEKKEQKRRERPAHKKEKGEKAKGGEKGKAIPRDEHGRREAKLQHSQRIETREEDPHEWLLEHYAAASPPRRTRALSPVEDKKQPPSYSFPSHARDSKEGASPTEDPLPHTGRADSKKHKYARSRTRTPTPLAMLEQELDAPNEVAPFSSAKAEGSETSLSLELDLAADAVPDDKSAGRDDFMDLDVEDELLSLLDDKPRPSHSRPKHVPSAHSKHTHSSKRTSDARHAHLTPDVQRESMPPPALTNVGTSREVALTGPAKTKGSGVVSVASHHKKKDISEKPMPKPKQPPKTKPKPAAKPKVKATGSKDGATSALSPASASLTPAIPAPMTKGKKTAPPPGLGSSAPKRSVSAAAGTSRSRSTSAMPGGSVGPEGKGQVDGEDGADTDDKLYCVCKTSYDEDRVMIACDRCDEWYHTQCVNMPDVEVDLVDQFICPPCIESNPHLSLRTTYKRRCLYGLKHPNPSSPSACHKPARGAFSKYCSDECGMLYMQSRIDAWGGDKRRLWESVKSADKREGVAVCVKEVKDVQETADAAKLNGNHPMPAERLSDLPVEVVMPTKTKVERDMAHLHVQLERVAQRRDELKKQMEVVVWREKLVEYATARAETLDECGWDQRLCFGDEEYAEFGAGVLESYEELDQQGAEVEGEHMQVDGAPEEGEWWCKGKKKCDRHAGWQKLRLAEVSFEKETMETALLQLTTGEREIRRQIEDVIDPKARTSSMGTGSPLQPLNGKASSNNLSHSKSNGDQVKKGKKRKN
ncbi:hypothetical protein SCP_0111690 [Sparassis crispa]|uniref:PHD-type domain-containing protein n=1 Tax=Sparassis crispa TaxID=139825 RepID=A0A401G7Y8_9APHY|nr:hypothetical protein SCP_0111690 [Sparassis crispa]GBE78286.1 hypothetical protein SCP_0111690 [Sparassis crispa]